MIKLTEEQQGVVDYLWEQVRDPKGHNTVISGKGGVGKTVLLCEMITQLLESGYKVAATAMTGKATAVLRGKVWESIREKGLQFPKENLKIETVSKITKESMVLGMSEDGETTYTNKWRDPRLFGYDVLFVDELSMVPQYISQWWLMTKTRVFAFGDFCQLPEVSTAETKRELAGFQHDLKVPQVNYVSGYGVKVLKKLAHQHLETVLRSDNEIAFLCDDLRDFSKTKSDIVKTIKGWSEKTDNIQYSTSLEDLETDSSWQIIAYTNKMCSYINNQLCIGGDYPDLSDKIILFDNLNPLGLYNGDTLLFGEFLQAIAKYNNPKQKKRIYVCMKWDGKMPRRNSSNPIERNFFNIYVQFKQALDEVNSRRMYSLASIIEGSGRPSGQIEEWLGDIDEMRKEEPHNGKCFQNIVEKFYEIDRDMGQYIADMSEPVPRLYVVNCGYGFAVTTHRSQGSEFPKVCYLLERFDKPLLYTGISRAKKKVKVINLTKER